jgi:hypothetical protein
MLLLLLLLLLLLVFSSLAFSAGMSMPAWPSGLAS